MLFVVVARSTLVGLVLYLVVHKQHIGPVNHAILYACVCLFPFVFNTSPWLTGKGKAQRCFSFALMLFVAATVSDAFHEIFLWIGGYMLVSLMLVVNGVLNQHQPCRVAHHPKQKLK